MFVSSGTIQEIRECREAETRKSTQEIIPSDTNLMVWEGRLDAGLTSIETPILSWLSRLNEKIVEGMSIELLFRFCPHVRFEISIEHF